MQAVGVELDDPAHVALVHLLVRAAAAHHHVHLHVVADVRRVVVVRQEVLPLLKRLRRLLAPRLLANEGK